MNFDFKNKKNLIRLLTGALVVIYITRTINVFLIESSSSDPNVQGWAIIFAPIIIAMYAGLPSFAHLLSIYNLKKNKKIVSILIILCCIFTPMIMFNGSFWSILSLILAIVTIVVTIMDLIEQKKGV